MTIYYASKYGAVSDAVEKINGYLGGRAELIDLGRQGMPKHMDPRGPVLVGGPIYAGTVMRPVREFCERHLQDLLRIKTGLFISCLYRDEEGKRQLETAFPPELRAHAFNGWVIGGRLKIEELTFFHKLIITKMVKQNEDIDTIDEALLREIAEAMAWEADIAK
ncbi:MAG: flavodoxin domain-containing protein [Alkalispirochaetaceae bacterium]